MAWMAWNDSMSVGDAMLDSDHRIILNLLNQLHDATETGQSREVVGSVVGVLAEYVQHHFRREEAMMAEAGVPDLARHQALHHQLEGRVYGIRDRWQAGDRAALGEEVVGLLKKWLTEHILVVDKIYRPWIEQAGRARGDGRGRPSEGT